MLIPGQKAPDLKIETVGHGLYDIHDNAPPEGTLVIFYRGLHCPICRNFLKDLDDRIGDFAIRGIRLLALSGDTKDHAHQLIQDMQLIRLPIAYGLSMKTARDDWGLYLSDARENSQDPSLFAEPGLFWVRSDGNLFFSAVQTLPFIRPHVADILKAIDFTLSKGFPPRGAYVGDVD